MSRSDLVADQRPPAPMGRRAHRELLGHRGRRLGSGDPQRRRSRCASSAPRSSRSTSGSRVGHRRRAARVAALPRAVGDWLDMNGEVGVDEVLELDLEQLVLVARDDGARRVAFASLLTARAPPRPDRSVDEAAPTAPSRPRRRPTCAAHRTWRPRCTAGWRPRSTRRHRCLPGVVRRRMSFPHLRGRRVVSEDAREYVLPRLRGERGPDWSPPSARTSR